MTFLIISAPDSWASTVFSSEKQKKNTVSYFTLVEPNYSQLSDVCE